MIVVFPMLTSSNVSASILPGMCKMLEKYVISHNLDEILKQVKSRKDIQRVGAKLKLKEEYELSEQRPGPPGGIKPQARGGSKININLGGGKSKPGVTTGDAPRIQQSIGLEPTWVKVDTPEGANVLGIKVIPTQVKSDEELIDILLKDKNLSKMRTIVTKNWRKIARTFFKVTRLISKALPFDLVGGGGVTGDPNKDILFAMTKDKGNVLVCLNYGDIQDDDFTKSTGSMRKLYALGWKSFVFADDVNKRAIFCLNQFNGMCSIIPYNFIYSSLGKEHKEVFDDLTDVRKQGGAFFKMKTNIRKVVGEAAAAKTLDSYTPISEQEVLFEDFNSTVKRMNPNAAKSSMTALDQVEKTGNKGALSRITSKIPSMDISKIDMIIAKLSPDFKKNKDFASRVLKNSLKDAGPAKISTAATIMAMGASQSSDSHKALRASLKTFVTKVRKEKMNESELLEKGVGVPASVAAAGRVAKAKQAASSAEKTIKSAGSAIKKGAEYVAGDAASQPDTIKSALKWIRFSVDAAVRSLTKVAEGVTLSFAKLANYILRDTKTKVVFSVGFIIVILMLVLYLARNE